MSIKDKLKSYNFWISLASAVVLIVRIIGEKYNFFVDTSLIMDITTALCSVFVILGILSVPKSSTKTDTSESNITIDNQTQDSITDSIEEVISDIVNTEEDSSKEEEITDVFNEENISNNEITETTDLTNNKPAEVIEKNTIEENSNIKNELSIENSIEKLNCFEDIVVGAYNILNKDQTNKESNIQALLSELRSNIEKASTIIEFFNNNSNN